MPPMEYCSGREIQLLCDCSYGFVLESKVYEADPQMFFLHIIYSGSCKVAECLFAGGAMVPGFVFVGVRSKFDYVRAVAVEAVGFWVAVGEYFCFFTYLGFEQFGDFELFG